MSLRIQPNSSHKISGVQGIRVLDLAGPQGALCGKLLADLGADVVRIEPPTGDTSRRFPPLAKGYPEASLFFEYFNTNKRSVVLDFTKPQDQNRFLELVENADVLLESFHPGHLASFGLDSNILLSKNPALIFVSLTDFGQSGPYHQFSGSDIICWAMGGLMSIHGDPDKEPLNAPSTQSYQCTSLWGVIATLATLLRRHRTGLGATIDLSAQEVIVDISNPIPMSYIHGKRILKRLGSHQPLAHPFGIYPTSDGYAFIGVAPQPPKQWETLLNWIESTASIGRLNDPMFRTVSERIKHRAEVDSVIENWSLRMTSNEIFVEGAKLGVPTAPIRRIPEVLQDDQLIDRGFFTSVPKPSSESSDVGFYPGLPFRSTRDQRVNKQTAPAPMLGAHTQEVIREWRTRPINFQATGIPKTSLPLEGINVLELCWWAAGPTLGQILGDLGATVIKVELREIGDPGRRITGDLDNLNRSPGFNALNRNKMSVTIDLSKPGGRDIFLQLAVWADVAINNFTPGTLERLGIGYDELEKVNPSIILSSISGYGLTGPRKNWVSFHPTAAGLSGLTGLFAYKNSKTPMGFVNAYTDYATAYMAAIGTIEALLRRQKSHQGDHVDISMLETGVSLIGPDVLQYSINREVPEALGNESGALGAIFQGCYRCAGEDSWVVVTVPDVNIFNKLTNFIAEYTTRIIDSPKDAEAMLIDWLKDRDAWDAMFILQSAGIPTGVVSNGSSLLEQDEHLKERKMFPIVTHPEIGATRMSRNPIILDGHPLPIRTPGPLLGEHTEFVMRNILELSEKECITLLNEHVI